MSQVIKKIPQRIKVKPILSVNHEDSKARVRNLYKAWHRLVPTICKSNLLNFLIAFFTGFVSVGIGISIFYIALPMFLRSSKSILVWYGTVTVRYRTRSQN